jgi:hypothetical protein
LIVNIRIVKKSGKNGENLEKMGKMEKKWADLSAHFFSFFFSFLKKIFSIYIGAAQLPSASLYCQNGFVPA